MSDEEKTAKTLKRAIIFFLILIFILFAYVYDKLGGNDDLKAEQKQQVAAEKKEKENNKITNKLTKHNIELIVRKSIGAEDKENQRRVIKKVHIDKNRNVSIKIYNKMLGSFGDEHSIQYDAFNILEQMDKVKDSKEVRILWYTDFKNANGEKSIQHYALVAVSKKTRNRLNFEDLSFVDIPKLADQYVFRE